LTAALVELGTPRSRESAPTDPSYSVLFVCYGNICRSAMAEGILRTRLHSRGLAGDVRVASAGTSGVNAGRRADPRARTAVRRRGGDIRDLRARRLADDDFENFDLILVMDEQNRIDVLGRAAARAHAAKVRMLLDYIGGGEITDPIHGSQADFEHASDDIARACDRLIDELVGLLPTRAHAAVS
jgi:protein-tyrosine phosphatase